MSGTYPELRPSSRLLLGPGPSPVDPRVLRAMSAPTLGHLDPEFLGIMNECMDLLRYVFETRNQLTIPMSGTGSAGMETVLVNLIEPGDNAVVCANGVFGGRMVDVAGRCGAEVIRVSAPWGRIIDPEDVRKALKGGGVKLVGIVHAETSTGAHQPLEEISRIVHDHGALLVVDAVTSLGGMPVKVDEWGIDACYSGTQKCVSCPPGLAPVTFGPRAVEALGKRKSKVQSWYLDLTMIQKYWTQERFYHHTAPINMIYALREALRLIHEEGLEARFARHKLNSDALVAGVRAMGLGMAAQEGHRLVSLNAVRIPEGVDDLAVRKRLLQEFDIEIGGGLGDFKGKVWRIGLMGYGSQKKNVFTVLAALEVALAAQGYKFEKGAGIAAAAEVYGNAAGQ
ncbi:MAG: alanine--glyoxylate aminotransferase family protein [Actinobacteria bacterium]|nr:alanine--glyoxylate aminotransferase family protein [Actinomycetota bacterium]